MSAQDYLFFQADKQFLSEQLAFILRILLDDFMDVGELVANRSEVQNLFAYEHPTFQLFNFAPQCCCYDLRPETDP